jgi:DNA-binding NarL/FixJ family response regulator
MTQNADIKIIIVDDHALFRRTLKSFLQSKAGMQVVGEAENGQVAVQKARELCPDVILMDISMPILGGIEATRQVRRVCRKAKIIALSNQGEDYYMEQMRNAGASNYVLKSTSGLEIEKSIRNACSDVR